jgi:hypothetical protein
MDTAQKATTTQYTTHLPVGENTDRNAANLAWNTWLREVRQTGADRKVYWPHSKADQELLYNLTMLMLISNGFVHSLDETMDELLDYSTYLKDLKGGYRMIVQVGLPDRNPSYIYTGGEYTSSKGRFEIVHGRKVRKTGKIRLIVERIQKRIEDTQVHLFRAPKCHHCGAPTYPSEAQVDIRVCTESCSQKEEEETVKEIPTDLLSIRGLSKKLGLHRSTISSWRRQGVLIDYPATDLPFDRVLGEEDRRCKVWISECQARDYLEEHYGAARVAYRHQDPPEMEEEPPTKMDIGEEMKEVRKAVKDLSEAVKDLRAMLSLQNSVAVTKGPLASWWTRIWGK